MKTIYVLDTSVLLHDAQALFEFGENEVVAPPAVVEELDGKKGQMNAKGYNARKFFSFFKENASYMEEGKILLENGGSFRIEVDHISLHLLQEVWKDSVNDNRIIAVALNLAHNERQKRLNDSSYEKKQVILVTMDGGMFTRAVSLRDRMEKLAGWTDELDVMLYENDRLEDVEQLHEGFHEVSVPETFISFIYRSEDKRKISVASSELFPYLCPDSKKPVSVLSHNGIKEELANHQIYPLDFVTLKALENPKHSCLAQYKLEAGEPVLSVLRDPKPNSYGIAPRNSQQQMAIEVLTNPDIKIVFLIGSAGTGKTLLALMGALLQSEPHKEKQALYNRVTMTRAVMPLGKDIGHLPGEKEDKLLPWMAPFYDNLEVLVKKNRDTEEFASLMRKHNVSIEALTYMRGRTLPGQFIVIDEVQNMTRHEVLTILTRVGEGSKIVLMGDPKQIDNPYLDRLSNGLVYAAERMKTSEKVAVLHLVKSERSEVASLALAML